jgi:hypothetical protein
VNMAIDHVFVCCEQDAPESEALLRLGFDEGPPNRHPGQGTACRRFVFANAYLELIWVEDPDEARSEAVRPTRLWDRWSRRGAGVCPFGIILRPVAGRAGDQRAPFPAWRYAPSYMPAGLTIDVAEGTSLSEPEIFHIALQRGAALARAAEEGRAPKTLTTVGVAGPLGSLSAPARALEAAGLVSFREAETFAMELGLDAGDRGRADLRPELPLVLRW